MRAVFVGGVLSALLGCGEASFVSLGRNDERDAQAPDQDGGPAVLDEDAAADAALPGPARDASPAPGAAASFETTKP